MASPRLDGYISVGVASLRQSCAGSRISFIGSMLTGEHIINARSMCLRHPQACGRETSNDWDVKKLWVLRGRFDVIYFARGDPGSRLAQG